MDIKDLYNKCKVPNKELIAKLFDERFYTIYSSHIYELQIYKTDLMNNDFNYVSDMIYINDTSINIMGINFQINMSFKNTSENILKVYNLSTRKGYFLDEYILKFEIQNFLICNYNYIDKKIYDFYFVEDFNKIKNINCYGIFRF